MRRSFARTLLEHARLNPDIVLLTADMGFGMWDEFKNTLPGQYINCGAAEQAMLDIAVGLALSGKIPFAYSITTFLVLRPFETIRTYLLHENLHVILVGSGEGRDYEHDGYSHDATDIPRTMQMLGIAAHFPVQENEMPGLVERAIRETGPIFISLRKR